MYQFHEEILQFGFLYILLNLCTQKIKRKGGKFQTHLNYNIDFLKSLCKQYKTETAMDGGEQKEPHLAETKKPGQHSKKETRSRHQLYDTPEQVVFQWNTETFSEREDDNALEHDTKETRSKCKTHDDPEEDIYQREANILHKREDEHQSAVSKDEIKSKFTHDASEDAVFKLKADTFHERQYAKPSEYGKKDTRSKSQKHDAMGEVLYQWDADSDEDILFRGQWKGQSDHAVGSCSPLSWGLMEEASDNISAVPIVYTPPPPPPPPNPPI
ncbi:unnamed protein product [Mytilus edulis]|uniref:Uncharacterized protein n=1 Tax=Mytilus edulis TaxID=6550 RepID=A0A8S3UAN4_MYTED|nr:unnamed protein product [Mytilus edulis]